MCIFTSCSFLETWVLIILARLAYFKVLWVSSKETIDGLTLVIMTVLQFPPRESFSSRVSLLSLKGMCFLLLLPSALMQLARASRDLLMFAPSTIRIPLFLVTEALSEPARSIKDSFPILTCCCTLAVLSLLSTITVRTACEREDTLLACVDSVVRAMFPRASMPITSSEELATSSVMPEATTPLIGSSCTCTSSFSGFIKSRMFSLYTSR
mmetsp:Transcript_7477/g.14148  ORF Transcript_7477/g.14148 Transcript_7477/m.14148 type:complete len:211 (-) Transcript_7477:1064-1696(-)